MIWTKAEDRLPPEETPVLIVYDGTVRIGELRWDHPGWEETYQSYLYWDDPNDDGQDWCQRQITHWTLIPEARDQHPDDVAVDRFAAAMKRRMAEMRDNGKFGWDAPEVCSIRRLRALMAQVAPDQPVDIGNYAMMLLNRTGSACKSS